MNDIPKHTLETIRYLRESITPTPVRSPEDLKSYTNSMLFGYAAGEEDLDRQAMQNLFHKKDDISTLLMIQSELIPEDKEAFQPPKEWEYILPEERAAYEVRRFQHATGGFGLTYPSHSPQPEERAVIVGNAERKTYTYPSGQTVQYHRIGQEATANVSISDMGYTDALIIEGKIQFFGYYVRQKATDFLLALLDVVKDREPFRRYKNHLANFERDIEGIVLAHEITESDIFQNQDYPVAHNDDRLAFELYVEHHEIPFLYTQGVPEASYELFHLLRAGDRQSISRAIVDAEFQPLKAARQLQSMTA